MKHDFDLIRLHEAKTAQQLAQASFDLFGKSITNLAFFLTLRPGEFELPSFSSDPAMQKYFDVYISGGHKYDIWMRRGPINPNVRAIRHSDHTPLHILKRSLFFKKIIGVTGCSYGASVMAWRENTWLSTLTVFRTFEQGDFTGEDMERLRELQGHFESAVKRVAELHESKLGNHSLEIFIWGLPTAAIVLSWDLEVLHFNAAAQDLCRLWRFGSKARMLKNAPKFQLPGEIIARIRQAKNRIPDVKPLRHNRPKIFPMIKLVHKTISELSATVCFLPSKSLAVTRGTFLITLEKVEAGDGRVSYNLLNKLSRREREIIQLALQGMNCPEIGRQLGTAKATVRTQFHQIYRKLKVRSRHELVALLQSNALN